MIHRQIYIVLGILFVVIGIIGIVLPVLPTTPFMLLALWAFARSSQRLHDWLLNHRRFGPPLQRWNDYGVIPTRAKVTAVGVMSLSLIYLTGFSDAPLLAIAAGALLMLIGASFIITRPGRVPQPISERAPTDLDLVED